MAQTRPRGPDSKPTVIHYKEGEPLPGLLDLYNRDADGLVEVIISPEQASKDNARQANVPTPQVKSRQIWGDTYYTADSDIVAVLMHMGFYAYYLSHPPSSVLHIHALIRLLPPKERYNSKSRFVKSRAWHSGGEGCAFQVEKCWLSTRSGSTIPLDPCVDEIPAPAPTVQPSSHARSTISTRTAGAKSKMGQEISVQFNLANEPWLKYTLSAVADKGLKPSQWTSARLHDEVLLLETTRERFQICFLESVGEEGARKDLFSFARCKSALPLSLLHKHGVPLPAELVEVLEQEVEWEDFKWGTATLHLRGAEYVLKRMHFMPAGRQQGEPGTEGL